MKLANIGQSISKIAGSASIILKKNSPEILMGIGIVGVVASGVFACRATLKVEEVLDDYADKRDKIEGCWNKVQDEEIAYEDYTEKDHQKDITIAYVQTAVEFVKLYTPAVTLAFASITCILAAHKIMKQRNVALVAAYKAVEEGFNAYRKRVVEEHGEEADYMYKNGLRAETVTETEVGEDGKTKKVKKVKIDNTDKTESVYARYFDPSSKEWQNTPEYNLYFLKAQQAYFNNLLQARGHVFLNEVYDELGLPRSRAGAVVGWTISKDGNNYIDFGIFDGDNYKSRDFVNGYESAILLDFNVDGVIYDLI